MKQINPYGIVLLILSTQALSQQDTLHQQTPPQRPMYKFNYRVEVPVTVVGAAITGINFAGISKKSGSTEAQIDALNEANIPWFDRWTVHEYSNSMDQASYIPFYLAIPLPLLSLVDKNMRKDFWKIGYLYIEAL